MNAWKMCVLDIFEKVGDATKPQVVSTVLGGNLDLTRSFHIVLVVSVSSFRIKQG